MTPSSALESRFRDVLKSQGVPRGAVCLIGFSGGGDSAALLGLAADAGDWMFHAARVTHGLRSFTEEETERGLCRDLCHRLYIQYTDLVLPPGKIAAMEGRLGCGTEQAARQARSTLLEQHRQSIGADFILLGHTADDQLETILMRLLTGSGPEGLKGIPMRRGKILRPLLGETRAHLRSWLREKDMQWAEDSMNASSKYRRSRIRNELVPLISSIIPGWEKAALTLAERSMEVQIALDSVFRRCIQAEWTNREGRWAVGEWDSAPRVHEGHGPVGGFESFRRFPNPRSPFSLEHHRRCPPKP